MSIENYQRAAKIIRADAAEGFNSASKLVGEKIAFGMLVVYLRDSYNGNPPSQFPDKEDTEKFVEDALKGAGIRVPKVGGV